jgi:hypothetical protein
VHWAATSGTVSMDMGFHFSSNMSHWFLHKIVVEAAGLVASGLQMPAHSTDHRVVLHGHTVTARKGYPFECHYLELPLTVTDMSMSLANTSSAPCAPHSSTSPAQLHLGRPHKCSSSSWQA